MARVLIVDDEQWAVEGLHTELGKLKHEVVSAESISEAEDHLQTKGPFDGVILDIIMPLRPIEEYAVRSESAAADAVAGVVAGARFYRTLQHDWPKLPVVIYSVREEAQVRKVCPDVNFDVTFFRKGEHLESEVVAGLLRLVEKAQEANR